MSRGGDEEATAEFEAGEEGWMTPLLAHRTPPVLLASLARRMTAKTSNVRCAPPLPTCPSQPQTRSKRKYPSCTRAKHPRR